MSKLLDWEKDVSVCTDGAASMTGKYLEVVSKIKNAAKKNCINLHCIKHRQHLVVRKILPDLNEVLIEVVKIINSIKSSAFNSRLFSILCKEMGSEHLLRHAEVR